MCSEWKEIENINEGDIIYFMNGMSECMWITRIDVYFSTTNDIEFQGRKIKRVLEETRKNFCVKLINRKTFM